MSAPTPRLQMDSDSARALYAAEKEKRRINDSMAALREAFHAELRRTADAKAARGKRRTDGTVHGDRFAVPPMKQKRHGGCGRCGKAATRYARGRCNTCYSYARRHGHERPLVRRASA